MAEIARYSKAYVAEQFRKYQGWHEKAPPAKISMTQDGAEGGETLEYFFLHDNYVVTSDIFPDRYIVFDSVTDDWKRFCHEVLLFNRGVDINHAALKRGLIPLPTGLPYSC